MVEADPLKRITTLYHFTDRRNLESILKLGGLLPLAKLRERGIAIPAPGGNDCSHEADATRGLDAYVHLCFRPNHPMEYVARKDGRIGDTIFLEAHPSVQLWAGVKFSADVSNKSEVAIATMEEARGLIDFEVLYTRTDWKDPDVKRRLQQSEKYEILVPGKIPLEMIRNLPHG